jgi:hypothetical protein
VEHPTNANPNKPNKHRPQILFLVISIPTNSLFISGCMGKIPQTYLANAPPTEKLANPQSWHLDYSSLRAYGWLLHILWLFDWIIR